MTNYGTVTIYMQVYNTKPYLDQCLNSVLSQTYTDWEFILVDNGCTDGSSEILKNFAAQDSRVRLTRFEENQRGFWRQLIRQYATGAYFTLIDSDDWWEPNYLERLVTLAREEQLDIVHTGCVMHIMATGKQSLRQINQPLIFSKNQFPEAFPICYRFLRTTWGKLVRMDIFESVRPDSVPDMPYGGDTAHSFQLLRHSSRIGFDSSVLYHYRMHSKSTSYQYNCKRFETDVYLYHDAMDFLAAYGPISYRNRIFLQCVYSNAIYDTDQVICGSTLTPAEKLKEYRRIASHPLTQAAYRECEEEAALRSKSDLIMKVLEAGAVLKDRDDENLRVVTQTLLPRCGRAVTSDNIPMFLNDRPLLLDLLHDDSENVLDKLLERLKQNKGTKKYNIPAAIQLLAADNILLWQINDKAFLRKYAKIYRLVWKGEYLPALEEMAGLLLENRVSAGNETFLTLFLSLAATLEQPSAFVFGKLQLAKLYLRQNRFSEGRAVVSELEEMGLEDNEELEELRRCLEES